ncbi:MAG: prolipoprotein diacylglyceryl transferase [Candidatus Absconditabacterales bacterium]
MIAFSIGSINIYRYGVFYVIAFVVGYVFLRFVANKKIFLKKNPNLQRVLDNNLEDILLYIILGILIGGRLGHVLIYNFSYYFANPIEIFQIRKGGMSFIGGMIGVVASIFLFKRINKLNKSDFGLLFDLILAIVPFGIMIGRIGNYLNQELYGVVVPFNYTMFYPKIVMFLQKINVFHVYDKIDNALRVNTNFLSAFFEGFVLLIITMLIIKKWIINKKYRAGQITGIFLIFYSFFRFLFEYLRYDSQLEFIGPLTISQYFFIIFFFVGVCLFSKKITL